MALPYSQLKLQGQWAMKIQGVVSLCPTGVIPPPPPPPTGAILTGFLVQTTTGNIDVNWGDGTTSTIPSNTPTNHTFYCTTGTPGGFWSQIDPCP